MHHILSSHFVLFHLPRFLINSSFEAFILMHNILYFNHHNYHRIYGRILFDDSFLVIKFSRSRIISVLCFVSFNTQNNLQTSLIEILNFYHSFINTILKIKEVISIHQLVKNGKLLVLLNSFCIKFSIEIALNRFPYNLKFHFKLIIIVQVKVFKYKHKRILYK